MNMSAQTTNPISRPTADFHPCHWGDHFLNVTHHDDATHFEKEQEVGELKLKVGELLAAAAKEPKEQLIFIDTLERLGVAYHFEKEIEEALERAHVSFHGDCENSDLNHVSLRFRIFRQHGFNVPCDVFNKFKDHNGKFEESLASDVPGILSLFEASHVRVHDDKILDEALTFTTPHLTNMATDLSSPLAEQVAHALHQPLHKGMPRVEARFYISIYEKDPTHNELVLQFAKLDFNFVQSLHQKELKDLKRWWKGLHMKASFSRDRITEAYFWIMGVYFEPQYSLARKLFGKVFKSTILTDDTYDAYGTLEELEVLTQAFQRPWNKTYMEELPEHVKWGYYAFVETCEEVEEELGKEGRAFCASYLRQQVEALSKGYMQEAKWCHQKYVPTYEEYMKNAIITSPYPLGTVAAFLGMGEVASKECFEWACQDPVPEVVKAVSIILRLMNDTGGHKFEQKRNHVASAVQCLMEHNKVSEAQANEMLTKQVELLMFFYRSSSSSSSSYGSFVSPETLSDPSRRSLRTFSWGGPEWERRVRNSAKVKAANGVSVLVTGAAGFVGTHVSAALKRRGDGVLGLDNFNDYYDPSLKKDRQALLERSGVFIVEGDINDVALMKKLFEVVPFTHVMHLAAQAGVRYAMQNPGSYVHSNIAGFVNLLEVCKSVNPQPSIVWASSSSVYGLNTKVPFSEKDRTDQPASLYAATKKAGEEIAHTYNHIYGLSLTGLRFFTVYGPWGRPDMAYFFFTRDILKGKSISIFEGANHGTVARDFTYIDDIVKGCLGALDTAEKSTGSGGKKKGPAQLRVFNLGNTSPVPVSDLVSILEKLLKVKAKKVVMTLPRNGDVPFTHANISYAQREFGYNPTTDLQSGLKKFVRWYLNYYKQGKKAVE